MTGLGAPLAVFREYAVCDGRQHEVELVTDGTRAYAGAEGTDLPLIRRDNTRIIVSCRVTDAGDEECHGEATFDLATEAWTADAEQVRLLSLYGHGIDQ